MTNLMKYKVYVSSSILQQRFTAILAPKPAGKCKITQKMRSALGYISRSLYNDTNDSRLDEHIRNNRPQSLLINLRPVSLQERKTQKS